MTRIWRINFGQGVDSYKPTADDIDTAMEMAREEYKEQIKETPESYEITSVELLAESDD